MRAYLRKMLGGNNGTARAGWSEILWSWLGSFLGIATLSGIEHWFLAKQQLVLLVGSWGATAVLLFGAPQSPLAQPRNLLGGHCMSALVGVVVYKFGLLDSVWAAAFAVSISIAAMHATRTLHPPGGATALIAVIGGPKIHQLGFLYVLMPVGLGATLLLLVALLVNNIPRHRRYPMYWI